MTDHGSSEHVSVEREIAASPDVVWSLISDVTRMGDWSPETTGCEWRKGATGPVEGARFRGRNQAGSRKWSTECVVTRAEPGRSFAFEVVVGPIDVAEWSYRIEPTAGGCRVEESWTDRRGWLAKKLGGVASGVDDRPDHNRRTMEQTLERLASAAESSAG
jgi:uncharacterized protein YndB with AHSA1/START domain